MSTFNTSQLLSFVLNSKGEFIQTSSGLASLLGYSSAELSGKSFKDISTSSAAATATLDFYHIQHEQVVTISLFHKNGQEHFLSIHFSVIDADSQQKIIIGNAIPNTSISGASQPGETSAHEQLEMLINNTEESFVLVDEDLKIVRFNIQFERLYKKYLNKGIIQGENIINYAYKQDTGRLKTVYARALAGEVVLEALEMPATDGEPPAHFSLNYKPVRSMDGAIYGVFVSIVDVSQQKASEQLLSVSEKRFKALVEHGMDLVVILTAEGKPLYISPAVEAILGYTQEEGANLDLFSLTHPDDIEKVTQVWEKVLQNPGVPIEGPTTRILHKNGTWRWLQDTITNMLHDPHINGIVDNFKDVTDKINAEHQLLLKQKELEQAEANYREIFEKANEGILIYNIDTKLLVEVNHKACEMLRCEQSELMSASRKQYEADIAGYSVKEAMAKFENVRQGETQIFEWPVKRKDNIITWLEISLTRATIAGLERILAFLRVIDERKKAEQEKEFERRDKEALMNSTGEFIWSVNKDLKLLAANEPFLDNVRNTIGYTLKAGESVLVSEFYSEKYLKLWSRLYHHAFEGHRFTEEVYSPAMADNPERWVEISFNPVYLQDQLSYVTCFGRDITETKQYQQLLQFTNAKLHIAQQIAKLGVWELDVQTQQFTCSKETYLIFGLQETDFPDNLHGFVNMIHPEDRPLFHTEFNYALEGEKLLNVEFRIITPTGLVKTVVLRGSVVYDAANNPSRFNGTVQDMTERKYLKDQLVASQRQLDLIYNSVNDIIFLMAVEPDEQYRFESVNQAFLNSMHIEKAAVINKYIQDVIPSAQVPAVLRYYRQALQTGKPVSWQADSASKNRSGIITITPVANDEGTFSQIIGSVYDITEIKRTGEKLVSLNEKLKIQAKAMAESNLELERFAYVASHDLQEPLRMISSFLKLLEKKYKGQLDETANKYIHYAVDGSERMKRLIMDLLEYSKVSTNHDALTSTNMNTLLSEVLHILDNKVQEQSAIITVGNLPVLQHTRRTQMFQLLQNLISNALKYHGSKPPIISINAREEDDRWEFSVKDNGVGFEQKFAESVFIMFQRLHHRSEFVGTGIGLSICKKIVEMHHGNIWVESVPNQGTTFYFTIGK